MDTEGEDQLVTASVSQEAAAAGDRPGVHFGVSHLHHFIGPHNVEELRLIHNRASHTATFYICTIMGLYLVGLVAILLHYMNSYYGSWNWNFSDIWTELRPMFVCCFRKNPPVTGITDPSPGASSESNDLSSVTSPTQASRNRRAHLWKRIQLFTYIFSAFRTLFR